MPGTPTRELLLNGPVPRWGLAWQGLIVLAVAGLVYWPLLGSSGLSFSEGLRAIPGWEMVRSGDWLVPRLFEQPYLRKPPGMPWAIALADVLLGESEFSARSVSALASTAGAMLSFLFATRWFGRPWGLAAGLAYALMPSFWFSGRSAEIEPLNNFFVLASVLLLVHVLIAKPAASAAWGLLLAAAFAGVALVKGPAGMPCIAGVVLGACAVRRSWMPLWNLHFWIGLVVAGGVVGIVFWRIQAHVSPELAITQPPTEFLWVRGHISGILLLPLAAAGSALPASLALPMLRFRSSRPLEPEDAIARALAWSVLASIAIYTLAGVFNARYAMPAVTALPCLAAYVLRDAALGSWTSRERVLRRILLLFRPWIWAIGLLVGAAVYVGYTEPHRARVTSGHDTGIALGGILTNGSQVWAESLVDNRPEVLYYAQRRAAELGRTVHPRWVLPNRNGLGSLPIPPRGSYLILMEGPELDAYKEAGALDQLHEVFRGLAHKFFIRVYQSPE